MVEVRDVGGGRFEVFAQDMHWEAFTDSMQARDAARDLAEQIYWERGVSAFVIEIPCLPPESLLQVA